MGIKAGFDDDDDDDDHDDDDDDDDDTDYCLTWWHDLAINILCLNKQQWW